MDAESKRTLLDSEDEGDKKMRLNTKVEPFKDDGADNWDDSLIPDSLVQEIWAETFSPDASDSSSDEPYEFITDSGTAITLLRKKDRKNRGQRRAPDGSSEEEEDEVETVPSIQDVEGGVPKSQLKDMSIEEIQQCLADMDEAMNFILAENIVFERTIGRMEQRDREIEAAMPIFKYKYPWELEDDSDGSDKEDSSQSGSDDDYCYDESADGSTTIVGGGGGGGGGGASGAGAGSQEGLKESSAGSSKSSDSGSSGGDYDDDDGGLTLGSEIEKEPEESQGQPQEDEEGEMMDSLAEANRRKSQTKLKKKKEKKQNPMIGPDGKIREICEWEDSDDEEFQGTYEAIQPAREISVSKDKFFEGMPFADRYAIRMYIQSFGEIAPPYFDYMRHKYGKLINTTYMNKDSVASEAIQEDNDDEIREHQKIFDEVEGLGDEDPDFPGFFPRSAKRLPLEYKYKYAEEEEEILEKEIVMEQTKAYRKENSIQVLIDTNIDAFELLTNLNEEFTEILKHAHHPLTKKLMAERILKFRKSLRSKILAEETKITMSLVELQKVRKKVNEQLKTQQEMGFKLQKIDFEQIRIRNNEFTTRIESAHTELKGLKLLTAGCFQVLKEQRQKLNRKIKMHARMVDDIDLRETLMVAFQADLQKYTQILDEVQNRNNFMRKRIRAFKVPNSMEYIRFKAILYGLEEEVSSMKKRLRSTELNKTTHQLQLENLAKGVPISSLQTLNDNDEWLEKIKKEVAQKGLLCLLTEDEMNNSKKPDEKKSRVLGSKRGYVKNPLLKGIEGAKSQFVTAPKHIRDNFDPEGDEKDTMDIARLQNNQSKARRQTFNRLYEYGAKDKTQVAPTKLDHLEARRKKCGDVKFRRGIRGNLVIETRDKTKLNFLAKC